MAVKLNIGSALYSYVPMLDGESGGIGGTGVTSLVGNRETAYKRGYIDKVHLVLLSAEYIFYDQDA